MFKIILLIENRETINSKTTKIEIDDLKNLFEIIDDKCDDEIIIHVFSQFKKKHVVDAFFCYDVLTFDNKYFKFVRH